MRERNDIWDYFSNLSDADEWLPEAIQKRLKIWNDRFEFYADLEEDEKWLKTIKKWKRKNSFQRHAKKLKAALSALQELKHKESMLNKANIRDITKINKLITATLEIIDIELLKLEITQLRLLGKAQNLTREIDGTSVYELEAALKKLREQFHTKLEDKKIPFSKKAKQYELNDTFTLFHSREKKIHFSKHFRRSDKTADTLAPLSALNNLLSRIAKTASDTLKTALEGISTLVLAIPFINAFISGIPIFLLAAKAWLRNKSTTKKIAATILVGVVIGGLIAAGLATVAAGGVAVALMSIGVYVKHIHPFLKMRLQIRKKINELKELSQTKSNLLEDQLTLLGPREKQFLIVQVEKASLENKLTVAERYNLISLIREGHFQKLSHEPAIKQMIKDPDLKSFLLSQMDKRKHDLDLEIKLINEKEKVKRWYVSNGLLAIFGAILVCIPTPITIIIGASLLLTSAFIGMGLALNLHTKIMNLFTPAATTQKDHASELVSSDQEIKHHLKNFPVHENPRLSIEAEPELKPISDQPEASPQVEHEEEKSGPKPSLHSKIH